MLGPERGDPGELQAFSEPRSFQVSDTVNPPWLFQKLSEIRAHSRTPLPGSMVIGGPLPHLSTPQLPGRKSDVPPLESWAYFHLLGFSLTPRDWAAVWTDLPYAWRNRMGHIWFPVPNFLYVDHRPLLPAGEVPSQVLVTPNPIPHPAQVDTPSRIGALSLIYLLLESCPELLYQSTAHRVSSVWASSGHTGSPWVGAISPLQGPRL